MKKLFFLLAIAGLASFAACKSGETKSEATADTTQVQAATTDTAVAAPAATDTTVQK
jgi:hypothetical protein